MGKRKGKTGRKNKKYSAEFKISVIMDMREHHLEYYETVRKYWDTSKGREEDYMDNVKRWERMYLEEGGEGLMKERRGKASSATGTRTGRPPKPDRKAEDDLIAENRRLRMPSRSWRSTFTTTTTNGYS